MSPKRKVRHGGSLSEYNDQDGPAAYAAGGFDIQTDIGRVDNAEVSVDDEGYEARVTATPSAANPGAFTVQVYTIDFAGGAVAEVAGGTDLGGVTFYYEAHRL